MILKGNHIYDLNHPNDPIDQRNQMVDLNTKLYLNQCPPIFRSFIFQRKVIEVINVPWNVAPRQIAT